MTSRPSSFGALWAAANPVRARAEARRRIGRAVAAWMALALTAVVTVTTLIVWHLVRRGRLIRETLPPPRAGILPELLSADSDSRSSESLP